MNVSYGVAVALLDGDVLIEQFSATRINSDDVWNLIDRTHTHHQSAYDRLPVDERLTTQVRITLTDGSTHAATVAHPKGNGKNALTNPEIREKYRKLTNRAISPDRQAAIEHAVLNLDTVDDVSQLTGLLTPMVHSPLD
jgi:2-methylcitrate dehydratase PrpD